MENLEHSNPDNESPSSSHLSSPMPIWIDNVHLSPKWLEAKINMKANSIQSCTAKDVSNKNRKGDTNNDGATIRIFVTLHGDDDQEGDHSSRSFSLIIKQTAMQQHQTVSKKLGLAREAFFYNQLQEVKLFKGIMPKIYYSYGDYDKTGSKCIIMEDLTCSPTQSCIDSGILFGKGNPNNWTRDLPDLIDKAFLRHEDTGNPNIIPSSKEVALTTFREIAKIHAIYWKNSNLLTSDKLWLRGQEWLRGKGKESWEASQNLARTLWKKYLDEEKKVNIHKNIEDNNKSSNSSHNSGNLPRKLNHLIKWDDTLQAVVEKAMNSISWDDQLKRLNTEGHWTLVHGDFWPGNVMWMIKNDKNINDKQNNNESSSVRFLDWEMVGLGSGPQDLGQYVISNMNPVERKECEYELIQTYMEELKKTH